MRIVLLVVMIASWGNAEPCKRKAAVPEAKHVERKKPVGMPTKPVTADAILAGEIAADGIRVQQEQLLEQLARDTPDTDPEKPDILFRLAEHYSHELLIWRLRANQ